MPAFRVTDWDGAYANGVNIPDSARWPAAWEEPSARFRRDMEGAGRAKLDLTYGPGARHRLDLFLPAGEPKGLVVFIHGGYWMRFDKSFWSHLAAGSVERGFAVAMPSYTLAPEIRIGGIVREVGQAVGHAAELVPGPIRLTGHSAGGHLASRMVAEPSPLPTAVLARVAHVVSISGLHDLRPLMRISMNETLRIDETEALAESPALLRPAEGARLTAWVGAAERAEFVRQNALIANIWRGLGAETEEVAEPDRHHFNVIDGLAEPDSPLTRALLGA